MDQLVDSRRLKYLTVLDDCSKESVIIATDTSIPAGYVTTVLDAIVPVRGLPKIIWGDNGPGFRRKAISVWAYRDGVALRFIQPGKPVQNAYREFQRAPSGRMLERALDHEHGARPSRDRPVETITMNAGRTAP